MILQLVKKYNISIKDFSCWNWMSTRNIFTRSLVFNKGERERERVVASFPIFSLLHMCHQYFLQYLPAQSLWIKVAIKCLPGVGSLSILSSGDRCCTMLTFCNNITYKWISSAKIFRISNVSFCKCRKRDWVLCFRIWVLPFILDQY